MCGRFASARKRSELLAEFGVERDRVEEPLEPDYNVAPTKPVYAVLTRRPHSTTGEGETAGTGGDTAGEGAPGPAGGEGEGPEPERQLRVLRWGLVPSWAKDPSIGSRLINARAETVASKPAFRRAFARRRCLVPADGYYEWVSRPDESGRVRKQPYYIHRSDGGPLAFAGLYEIWRDRARPEDDPAGWLWTAVIITTSATDEAGRIHDRMPMVVEPARWVDWLDPAATAGAGLHTLLAPAAASGLASYPVSRDVNSVHNNGAGLIEPAGGEAVRAPDGPPRARASAAPPAVPLELF